MKKAQKLGIVDENPFRNNFYKRCVQLMLCLYPFQLLPPIRDESAIVCHLNIHSLKWEGFLPHYWDLDSNEQVYFAPFEDHGALSPYLGQL